MQSRPADQESYSRSLRRVEIGNKMTVRAVLNGRIPKYPRVQSDVSYDKWSG
jgi:hypothetical protein